MVRKIKKLFENELGWCYRNEEGVVECYNKIQVIAFDDHSFIIVISDFIDGYVKDIASYIGNLDEAIELRNTLDWVIQNLRKEG